jgi:tetratricopeptide (TPR) repeat protein
LKDLQREWIHSVYTPEPTAAPSEDSAGDHWCSLADHAAERIRFLQEFGVGHAASGPPSLQAQLRAAEDAEAWPSVAEIARHMLANTPKDSALWEKRARAFAKAEDWTRCGAVVEEWAKVTQQKLPAMDALRGDVAEAEDRDEDAITAWKACLQAAPKDVETRDKLAEMLEDYNGWAESLPVRELRVKFQPTADSLAKLAVCYGTNGNWKAASAAIRRASAINATDDSVHDTMPKVERAEKEAPAIAKLDAAIAAAPKSVEPPLDRAVFFLGLGWPEITFRDAAAAEKLWLDSRGALVAKAAALSALGRKEDAMELAVNLSGDIKNPSILRALAKADGDLQSGGPNASILGRRAHELNRARQYDLSLEDCESALKLDPNCDAALAARGEALNATGDDWKALPDVKRATEINPHNPLAWYVRGVIESKHHNFAESADAFGKVLELQPNDREALAFREKSYRALGKTTEADADAAHNKSLEKK